MTLHKIEKEDFKTYRYQVILTTCYALVLEVVYGYWTMVSLNNIYVGIVVFLAFIIAGVLVYALWVNHLKNKKEKVDESDVHKEHS